MNCGVYTALEVYSVHCRCTRPWRYVHGVHGTSISATILERLGEMQTDVEKNLTHVDGAKTERVPGNSKTDELSFSTLISEEVQKLIQTGKQYTNRQVPRYVMKDTFRTVINRHVSGLLSPFIIQGQSPDPRPLERRLTGSSRLLWIYSQSGSDEYG